MLQVRLNIAASGMAPQQAVEAPRLATRSFPDSFWPHATPPGRLDVEARIAPETRAALASLGHVITDWPDYDWRAGGRFAPVGGKDGGRPRGAPPPPGPPPPPVYRPPPPPPPRPPPPPPPPPSPPPP